MTQLSKSGRICFCAALAALIALSTSVLAQTAQPEPKLKIKQGTGLVAVEGSPRHPNIEFECSTGSAVSVELLPTADIVTWQSPGCICADTAEAARSAIMDRIDHGDLWGRLMGAWDFKRDVTLKPGETSDIRLYCYSVKEMRERFQD